jgi:hypothetical protein
MAQSVIERMLDLALDFAGSPRAARIVSGDSGCCANEYGPSEIDRDGSSTGESPGCESLAVQRHFLFASGRGNDAPTRIFQRRFRIR